MSTAAYVQLSTVVRQYMDETGQNESQFFRLRGIAFRGLRDMLIDFAQTPKTRMLDVSPNKTVELPADYIQWVKIGVVNGNGEVATLKHNSNLSGYGMQEENRAALNNASDTPGRQIIEYGYYKNYAFGSAYYNLVGTGGGSGLATAGDFKVDEREGVILLNSGFGEKAIVMEYICSPEEDDDFMVPVQIEMAVIEFMHWRDGKGTPAGRRSSLGKRQMDRKDYYNERRNSKHRLRPFRMSDANDIIRLSNTTGIKA